MSDSNVLPFALPTPESDPDPKALLAKMLALREMVQGSGLGWRAELIMDCAVAAVRSCPACRAIADGQDNDVGPHPQVPAGQ